MFTNGFVRLEKEQQNLRFELSVATNQIADRDSRIASLTSTQETDMTVLTPQAENYNSDLLLLKEQIEILQNEILEKKQEISILTESLSARKQIRKEEKIVNMNLKTEVLELLILVQNGREELKASKIEFQRLEDVIVDYKEKDFQSAIRLVEFEGELKTKDTLDEVKERALKVSPAVRVHMFVR